MELTHGLYSWNVIMDCIHGLYSSTVLMECTYGMYSWNVIFEWTPRLEVDLTSEMEHLLGLLSNILVWIH